MKGLSEGQRITIKLMAVVTVIVSAVIGTLVFNDYQRQQQCIDRTGAKLANLLSELPKSLLFDQAPKNLTLEHAAGVPLECKLAYVRIDEADNSTSNQFFNIRVSVPLLKLGDLPQTWSGKRSLVSEDSKQQVVEHFRSVIEQGQRQATIRIGFIQDSALELLLSTKQYWLLLLIITMFLPFGLIMLRQEFSKIDALSKAIYHFSHDKSWLQPHLEQIDTAPNLQQQIDLVLRHTGEHFEQLQQDNETLDIASKLLAFKRKRVEFVLQALPIGIVILDVLGDCLYMNDKAKAWLAVSKDVIESPKPNQWCTNKEILEYFNLFSVRNAAANFGKYLEFNPEAALEKTMEIRGIPLFQEGYENESVGTLFQIQDVSEERQAKKHQSEFVAHIAHELKTPLNVLAMYSEALQGEDGDNEEFRVDAINIIYDEVERLSLLINNLLSLTKFEMGAMNVERTRVRLVEFLSDVFDNIKRSAKGKNINLHLDLPRDMSPLTIDKGLMRIAINNLMTNAIKYSRDGSTVHMSAEETDDFIRIIVKDSGIGISEEDQKHIFDKFYRSEDEQARQSPGHGLGLPLTKQIVQLHHGVIRVSSEYGKGSEFMIEFNKSTGLVGEMI